MTIIICDKCKKEINRTRVKDTPIAHIIRFCAITNVKLEYDLCDPCDQNLATYLLTP